MVRCHPRWWGTWLLALVLCACSSAPGTPTAVPSPAQATAPAATATPAPSPTPQPTVRPTVDDTGWTAYAQPAYGFSFHYPSDWVMEEDLNTVSTSYKHLLRLRPKQGPAAVITIGFKRVGEEAGIQRTGVGSGDLVARGSVTFLGEPVVRQVLVDRAHDVSVLYHNGAETRRGDLIFTLGLDYVGEDRGTTGLSEEIEAIADRVVESFALSP